MSARSCPRAFDVVSGDALYLDPKLCRELVAAGKDFIAVLKNDNRELIQDFYGLQEKAPVKTIWRRKRRCLCRDIEGFTSWTQFWGAVRVVRSEETRTVRRQRHIDHAVGIRLDGRSHLFPIVHRHEHGPSRLRAEIQSENVLAPYGLDSFPLIWKAQKQERQ